MKQESLVNFKKVEEEKLVNKTVLKIHYENRVKFWYKQFSEFSTEVEWLKSELEKQRKIVEKQRKIVEKLSSQNTQLIIELRDLQQQKEEMSFSDIKLQ